MSGRLLLFVIGCAVLSRVVVPAAHLLQHAFGVLAAVGFSLYLVLMLVSLALRHRL